VVSIRDCGTALSKEARAHLFDVRADGVADVAAASHGLGAARTIAESHQGTVGYEAREAGGSLFSYACPQGRLERATEPDAQVSRTVIIGQHAVFRESQIGV